MLRAIGLCVAISVFSINQFARAADQVNVAITQIVSHPALDKVREGIEDVLAENGYKNGDNLKLTFLSAQGNLSTATQIARKFVGDKPDVIVAISTPSAQTVLAATKEIPIVFSAISDPVEAKLVSSLIQPGGNITGVSDSANIAENLELLRKIKPNLKKLGYLYNAAEANSLSTLKILTNLASKMGIEVIPSSASKSSDVQAAVRTLVGKVDVIFVPTDNTVIAVLEGAAKIALETKTALFVLDGNTIGRGAFMTQGVDYYDVGVDTGELVLRILKGENPGDIDVVQARNHNIQVDMKIAKKLDIIVPREILENATKVIQ
ncbi:ABC transporter substrate-binding protein [Bartonella ancashensis]|uniref:ABC transporter substrate-binding protein n=1 Tax=Bartonella ancashensis TaxID=1318743 RepID=A0A0M4LJ37_9HYPH|nr:ABC transporter substrate-binding protein [Bartonella ancashensis]ALE03227.1 ABC transporter substrate-binding protein [Bartonella ancashensis]